MWALSSTSLSSVVGGTVTRRHPSPTPTAFCSTPRSSAVLATWISPPDPYISVWWEIAWVRLTHNKTSLFSFKGNCGMWQTPNLMLWPWNGICICIVCVCAHNPTRNEMHWAIVALSFSITHFKLKEILFTYSDFVSAVPFQKLWKSTLSRC